MLLPIGDGDGGVDDLDPLWVIAAMSFPRDATKQRQFIGRVLEDAYGQVEERAVAGDFPALVDVPREIIGAAIGSVLGRRLAPLGGFSTMATAPSAQSLLKEMFGEAWAGSVAGDMLSWIVDLHAHGFHGSVRKAVVLAGVYYSDATTEDGRNLGASKRYIQGSWKQFKPAAHLWAALRLWMFAEGTPPVGPDWLSPFSVESLPTFLTYARWYLRVVAAIVPHGREGPILERGECWDVPQGYPINQEAQIRFGALPDWIAEHAGKPRKK